MIKVKANTLFRLPNGDSILGHGFIRIPHLKAFSDGLMNGFTDTLFPLFIVKPFSLVLPFFELLLGIFILLGLKMKTTSIASVVLICILIFGSSFQQNWSAIAIQLFYGMYFAGLYLFSEFNRPVLSMQKT